LHLYDIHLVFDTMSPFIFILIVKFEENNVYLTYIFYWFDAYASATGPSWSW